MFVEAILFLVGLLAYCIYQDRLPASMPPGPSGIPFIGGMPIGDEKSAEALRLQYGDIVTHRMGPIRTILIFDYHIAKEVLSRPDMSDRPGFFRTFSVDDQKSGGLVGSIGTQWQHDRRFVLRHLRNQGMGKSRLEEAINVEALALVEDLKKYGGRAIHFPDSFRTAALNIVWQMVGGRRFDLHSKEVQSIYAANKRFQSEASLSFLPSMIPALRCLPKFLRNKIFKEHLIEEFVDEIVSLLSTTLTEHEKNFDPDHPRDLVDEYLKEMKECEGERDSMMRRGALLQIIGDLFSAGSDTVNNMLKWVAFLLASHPDTADRLHREVDAVVGWERVVSLQDKPSLPYVEAFVAESLRYSSMIALNVPRTASKDITIKGYSVPKDTNVVVSNYTVHRDPRFWADPDKFSPERFIDPSGRFQANTEGFMAFGSGRRQCLGESLARMELFLFSAALIQNFHIMLPYGVHLPEEYLAIAGLRVPPDTTLVYRTRLAQQRSRST